MLEVFVAFLMMVVVGLGAYSYYLRMKLLKAVWKRSKMNRLARDPKEVKVGKWVPHPAAKAAWKLALSLVLKSLRQQKFMKVQIKEDEDATQRFISGIVNELIDRTIDSMATHGGRLRYAGALEKSLAKRRAIRRFRELAANRRTKRLQRRKGQLAFAPAHLATACGQLRSVALEIGAAPEQPLHGSLPPPLNGPGRQEADLRMSLNSTAGGFGAGDGAPQPGAEGVPGQLPEAEGVDMTVPVAFRKTAPDLKCRGVWALRKLFAGNDERPSIGTLVVAFGDTQRGQLGLEPGAAARQVSKNTIITVEELRGCEPFQVEAAGVCSFVVGSRGQVWGFGSNRCMELGARKEIAQVQGVQRVKSIRDQKVVQMSSCRSASGQAHTLMLSDVGEVYTFGSSASGALGQGPDVAQTPPLLLRMSSQVPIKIVASGARHSLLLSDKGKLFTVGDNRHGQLGHGKRNPANTWVPKCQDQPAPTEGALASSIVKFMCCGDDHNLALTEDGTLFAWGANANGQLGLGHVGDQAMPVPVRDLQDSGIVSMACGSRHSIVAAAGGKQVWTFGSNVQGQLGIGQSNATEGFQLNQPVPVPALSNQVLMEVMQVAASGYHSLAVTAVGELYAWGDNTCGQLGFPREGHGHQVNHAVAGNVAQAKATAKHQLRSRFALEVDTPKLFSQGVSKLYVPVRVVSLALYKVMAVSTSDMHTLVMTQ